MGRPVQKLEPRALAKLIADTKGQRLYGDGGGLYLRVAPSTVKDAPPSASWVFRFMIDGQARTMGLGPYPDISLSKARDRAADARRQKLDGLDPIATREAEREAARIERAKAMTFRQCAERYIARNEATWKNPKHRYQWTATLEQFAYPIFGDVPVAAVDTPMVLKTIEPLWLTKTETASRLRGRIERVLDWSRIHGYRTGENPARWRGHLDNALAAPSKVRTVVNQPSLPYTRLGAFMRELQGREGVAALALEFLILTAVRPSEAAGATWGEIDLAERRWSIPADRMKMKRDHRVPLSKRAVAILEKMKPLRDAKAGDAAPVFPGQGKGKAHLDPAAMVQLLRAMAGDGEVPKWADEQGRRITVHGFRSTFRVWCAETVEGSDDIAEIALAHKVEGKVKGAYQRSDLVERRARLMDSWAKFCATVPAKAKAA